MQLMETTVVSWGVHTQCSTAPLTPHPHRARSSAAQHEKWKNFHCLHSAAQHCFCCIVCEHPPWQHVVSICCIASCRHNVMPYAPCVDEGLWRRYTTHHAPCVGRALPGAVQRGGVDVSAVRDEETRDAQVAAHAALVQRRVAGVVPGVRRDAARLQDVRHHLLKTQT